MYMRKMESKEVMKAIRLVCGAAQAKVDKREVAPEYVPQIDRARADLAMMRGTDVVDAFLMLQRSGLSLTLDVWNSRVAGGSASITSEKLQQPEQP